MTHRLDFILFAIYLAGNIALGLWVARRKTGDARGYFLAGDRLPWYAIGGSIIASNISTEHFIGMVGIAYAAGMIVAQWEWGNWFTFTVLIWVFLPYFIRGGLYTMPEFLERRFNPTCRYLFAVCSLVLWITAQMSVVMLAGGKAMREMFGVDPTVTILALALLAGSYTIYGGLISVAWTDFMQFIVMMIGGLVVAIVGLHQVGGLHQLMLAAPEKFKMVYPLTDKDWPWFGVLSLDISVGIWYNCTNQFIVQRCLGARSEWDARMGVIFAGFVKILMPLLIVVPGIVAFKLYPGLSDPDSSWPKLVRELVPAGLSGIVMAGLASGILSHISSVLNSCSTVFTMDLYKPLLGQHKPDKHLVLVGSWSGFAILAVATGLAIWLSFRQVGIFAAVQKVGMWVAAPVAAVFLMGVLWRGTTAAAATFVLVFGFPFTWFVENILFKDVAWLRRFDDSFGMNRTFVVWAVCMILLVVVSWFTEAPDPERIKGIIWSREVAKMPESERERNRGLRNLTLWWCIFMGVMLAVYLYMAWFQFMGPAAKF